MRILYPILGSTAAGHAINLVNPAANLIVWSGSPTHNANGVTFNGVNQWGNTNFNASSYASNNRHFLAYYDNTSNIAGWNFGAWNGITNQTNGIASWNGNVLRFYGLNDYTGAIALNVGYCLGINLSGTSGKIFSNGTVASTYTNTRTAPNGNIYLGQLNDIANPSNPNAAMYGTAYRLKFYCQGDALSDAEHLSLFNAVAQLQTSFARL